MVKEWTWNEDHGVSVGIFLDEQNAYLLAHIDVGQPSRSRSRSPPAQAQRASGSGGGPSTRAAVPASFAAEIATLEARPALD